MANEVLVTLLVTGTSPVPIATLFSGTHQVGQVVQEVEYLVMLGEGNVAHVGGLTVLLKINFWVCLSLNC